MISARGEWARKALLQSAATEIHSGLVVGPIYRSKELFSRGGQLSVFEKDVLRYMVNEGFLEKIGAGRSTKYRKNDI